jgi:hypothetical protein
VSLFIACVAACSGTSPSSPVANGQLAIGTWGGDSAGMIVDDSLTHVHIGCTFGDIPFRLALQADGRFDVAGNYLLKAYPIAVGPTMPARFSGRLNGSVLTISVVVTDTIAGAVVTRGPVMVKFGIAPRLGPCPICALNVLRQARARSIALNGSLRKSEPVPAERPAISRLHGSP